MTSSTIKSDSDVQRAVTQELEWDARVGASSIAVRAKNGVVTLLGSVDSYAKELAACDAAHRVAGVLDVADEIQIKYPGTIRSDVEIAEAVRAALIWDVYVPDERIRSTVSDGWVTLEGDVDQAHQREDAASAIERLGGLRGITNLITVKPRRVDSERVRASIEGALARRAQRAAKRIRVAVDGDTVKLSGTVESWAEKNAVERTACYSPGVANIDNRIVVDPYA